MLVARWAVIVVTYNSERYIRKLFDSLLLISEEVVVVVVDNASTDRTVELVKNYAGTNAILIENKENLGFGVANNIGMMEVDADYYFLLNSDAYFIGDTLGELQCYLNFSGEKENTILGIPLVYPDGTYQTYYYSYSSAFKLLLQLCKAREIAIFFAKCRLCLKLVSGFKISAAYVNSLNAGVVDINKPNPVDVKSIVVREVDWACGAALVIGREAYRRTKGFDPLIFLYGEDEDLCIRAKKEGVDVAMIPVTPIVHEFGWGKNKNNIVVSKLKYESLAYFTRKHFGIIHGMAYRILLRIQMKIAK